MGDNTDYYEETKKEIIKLIESIHDNDLIIRLYLFIKKLTNNTKE